MLNYHSRARFLSCGFFLLQVICTAHSKLSVDGQPRGGGKEYLAIIAKDGEKKGFFIRIVDKEVISVQFD